MNGTDRLVISVDCIVIGDMDCRVDGMNHIVIGMDHTLSGMDRMRMVWTL